MKLIETMLVVASSNAFAAAFVPHKTQPFTPHHSSSLASFTSSYTATSTTTSTITTSTTTSSTASSGEEFKIRTAQLCEERNLKLEKVKNARDISSAQQQTTSFLIRSGRVFRTGRVSDASPNDLSLLKDQIGMKTLVDLRSYGELKDDEALDRDEVFGDYTDIIWDERASAIKVLNDGTSRVSKKKNFVGHVKDLVGGAKKGIDVATHFKNETDSSAVEEPTEQMVEGTATVDSSAGLLSVLNSAADLAEMTGDCDGDEQCMDAKSSSLMIEGDVDEDIDESSSDNDKKKKKRFSKTYSSVEDFLKDESRVNRKERHFVAVMNELKYVKGTLSKVRKRDLAKAIIKSPGAIVSRRVRSSCKNTFLDRINEGGLHLMNEIFLDLLLSDCRMITLIIVTGRFFIVAKN